MKKVIVFFTVFSVFMFTSGCTDTSSTDADGNAQTEFEFDEVAIVNDTQISINSATKITSECSWEYDGECMSENTPDNDYFLVIDVTIVNNSDEELSISSMISFNLKDETGEQASYAWLTESVTSQLDDSIMPGDTLKGQIAYDVNESDYYYFYYQDSLLDDNIKFVINSSDITD